MNTKNKECRFGHICTSDCGNTKDCPCQYDHCCALTEDCEGGEHCDDHYTETPNPGSKEAVKAGCKCPVIDNHYGKGFAYGDVDPAFWINGDCPIHTDKKDEQK